VCLSVRRRRLLQKFVWQRLPVPHFIFHVNGSNWLQGQRMVSDFNCDASSINGENPLPTFGHFCDRLYLIETFQRHGFGCSVILRGLSETNMGFSQSPLNLPKGRQKMKFAP
jgi:hypothetical protein